LKNSIVGWVEVTKPFGYAVPEGRRRAGQRPTSHKIGVGFRSRSTQPTITFPPQPLPPLVPPTGGKEKRKGGEDVQESFNKMSQ